MSAATPLASLDGPTRHLAVGMAFVWALAGDRSVSLKKETLWWLIDFGAALLAVNPTVDALTLGGLRQLAEHRLPEFIDVARATHPDVLAACAEARRP